MRAIKFRGKNGAGKWVYGCLRIYRHGTYIDEGDGLAIIADPDTVGQYVCLDANGNEVYEGDYVTDGTGDDLIWEVIWDEVPHAFMLRDVYCIEHSEDLEHMEVVGNRFDNQESKF